MLYYGPVLAVGVTLGLPIAVIFAARAQGKAASAAVESMARQPDVAGDIRSALILSLALIEALVIYVLLMFFMLQGKLAPIAEVAQQLGGLQ